MKYLKTYRIYESNIDEIKNIKEEFHDIFLPVKDICHAKLSVAPAPSVVHLALQTNPTYNFSVSLNLDNRVVAIEDQVKSKYGQKYRSVINGDEIMGELASAIERCVDIGLVISSAQVCWINAGEWGLRYRSDSGNKNNSNIGPGLISKHFSNRKDKRAEKFPMEDVAKGHYPPEMLPDFLIEKGDRVRMVKITFEYNI